MRSVDALLPYAQNARTHSAEQVAQLVASIKEFGWTNPLLIDEHNQLIAGHGRLLAAKQMNDELVPCIVVDNLTDLQRRALIIADNKLALNSGWDFEMLRLEISELKNAEANLNVLGFSESELSNLLLGSNDANAEWRGMPEFDQQDKMAYRTIKVHFKDQDAVNRFAKIVRQKITEETRYIWYPQAEIEKVAHKRVTDVKEANA